MTDVGRMSVQELAGKVLVDVLRQAVGWLAQQLMEAEVSRWAGAGYGERSGDRVARRNGYRERTWDTRVGSIELANPSSGRGRTSPASWRRAAAGSRRWSRWAREQAAARGGGTRRDQPIACSCRLPRRRAVGDRGWDWG